MKLSYRTFTNAAGIVNGASIPIDEGGLYIYMITGTLTGAAGRLDILGPDGTTWLPVPGSAHTTTALAVNVELPAGGVVRSVLSAGTSTGVNAGLSYVRGG